MLPTKGRLIRESLPAIRTSCGSRGGRPYRPWTAQGPDVRANRWEPPVRMPDRRRPMLSTLAGRDVAEHTMSTARHTTGYIACGGEDRPLLIFVHGWPELSLSWCHQLPCFASLGFCAVAPDLRGYGRSSVYQDHASYALEHIVQDMLELLDALGRAKA